ncbi:MAG: hypothetical protein OXC19_19940 [Bryobacterales bacterium]|nr:hypothetical protein [Bryobacterales bacterium]
MKPKTVSIADSSYQPSREQLREDRRVDATFSQAIKALVRPVRVKRVMPKKRPR